MECSFCLPNDDVAANERGRIRTLRHEHEGSLIIRHDRTRRHDDHLPFSRVEGNLHEGIQPQQMIRVRHAHVHHPPHRINDLAHVLNFAVPYPARGCHAANLGCTSGAQPCCPMLRHIRGDNHFAQVGDDQKRLRAFRTNFFANQDVALHHNPIARSQQPIRAIGRHDHGAAAQFQFGSLPSEAYFFEFQLRRQQIFLRGCTQPHEGFKTLHGFCAHSFTGL